MTAVSNDTVADGGPVASLVAPTPDEGGARRGLLRETFVHIAGIGRSTESRLWSSGIRSWGALRQTPIGVRRGVPEAIERSEDALESREVDFFFGALPAMERWRTFTDFGDEFVAVDIETTGLSIYDHITVIGIEARGEYRAFVRGLNLNDAEDVLREATGLITFNGALFDLRFIQRTFPQLPLPRAHVDLRFLSRRIGFAGSLKRVEAAAELSRAAALADISGYEATVLWNRYEFEGKDSCLADLVIYNAADTCVLRPLAVFVVNRLHEALREPPRSPRVEDLLFDPDSLAEPVPWRRIQAPVIRPPIIRAVNGQLLVGRQALELPSDRQVDPVISLSGLRRRMRNPDERIVGIDLTGSEARPTGWALLQGELVVTGTLGSTKEIIGRTLACNPRLVSIDSPLSLPIGRDCTDDGCDCRAVGGITRLSERVLKRRGVNVYPCLIQSMQALTRRGMEIAETLREEGIEVIESYPGAAQDIMRIPRKRASLEQLRSGLERFGVRGMRAIGALTHDELDAVTSAVVGAFFLADLYEALGSEEEGYLILPSLLSAAALHISTQMVAARMDEQPVCLLVGKGAVSAARELGVRHDDSISHRDAATAILIDEDADAYWTELARHGPRLRSAWIDARDARAPRRPSFVDLHLREDDPTTQELLRTWLSAWLGESGVVAPCL